MSVITRQPLLRSSLSPLLTNSTRLLSTKPSPFPSPHDHDYSQPNDFLSSWTPPKDPKEAQAKLAMFRRDYAKQVRELRKEYFNEMELQRQEKQLKDEAKKEAVRVAKEERKAKKKELAEAKAAERKVFEEEFRQTLLKEREEKLEYWKMRGKKVIEKKKEKTELLRRQSSLWVGDDELERRILDAVVETSRL